MDVLPVRVLKHLLDYYGPVRFVPCCPHPRIRPLVSQPTLLPVVSFVPRQAEAAGGAQQQARARDSHRHCSCAAHPSGRQAIAFRRRQGALCQKGGRQSQASAQAACRRGKHLGP